MKKILLISYMPPCREHAGGQRLLDLYSEIKLIQPGLHLSLITHDDLRLEIELLKSIFDEVFILTQEQFLKDGLSVPNFNTSKFDVIDLQYHQAGALIGLIRKRWPVAKIIFSPMESQFRALIIAIKKNRIHCCSLRSTLGMILNAVMEIWYVIRVDKVVTVSSSDRDVLAILKHREGVTCLPTCISPQVVPVGDTLAISTDSATIVFFAYFGSITNREALLWYIQEVHPAICKALPNYRFRIVGNGLDESLLKSCTVAQVEVVGAVSTISAALAGATVGISPALSGAGIRGKIHQYAALGLPCVASPIACEGLSYKDGESIIIANTSHEFINACIALLQNKSLNERVKQKAMLICREHYQWSAWRPEIATTYELNC